MKIRMRSVLAYFVAATLIALVVLFCISRENAKRDAIKLQKSKEILASLCNKGYILRNSKTAAGELKKQIESGELDRWNDVIFGDTDYTRGRYFSSKDSYLEEAGIKISVVTVFVKGENRFKMFMPVLFSPGDTFSLYGLDRKLTSCLDIRGNDFTDYL